MSGASGLWSCLEGRFWRWPEVGAAASERDPFAQLCERFAQRGASGGSGCCPYVIRTDDAWHTEFGDEAECPRRAELLRSGDGIFDLDYDAILAAMYALSISADGDYYLCVPGIEVAALGSSEYALPGTAPAETLHTFTIDSSASCYFFRDCTTLTPLSAPVLVRLADPSGAPVVARSFTALPYPAVYLLSNSRDSVSMIDHTSGASLPPPDTADSVIRSQWLFRDATTRLAVRNHLPFAERAHFGQHKTAKALYDAVVARYSSPATAALGRLILPYLFPELSTFATVEDLITHLRISDTRYRAALIAEFLEKNPPPIYITLYFIVTCLPDYLRAVRDHFLALDLTYLIVDLLEKHLLAAETSIITAGAARGTLRTPFFEGCSPSPLAPSYASVAAIDIFGTEDVGAASPLSSKCRNGKGKGGKSRGDGSWVVVVEVVEAMEVAMVAVGVVAGVGASVAAVVAAVVAVVAIVGVVVAAVVAVGVELFRGEVLAVARGRSSSVEARPLRPSSFVSGLLSVGRLGTAMDAEMASWKSTSTYVDAVPPPGENIVDGMRIFRVKRPPGYPPVFKAPYVARGFSQQQGVEFFQTFSPTPKMTTLRVVLHVAAQRDYELHSLDLSTTFLQGGLHEEIWLRRPPGFTGSFLARTQWSLRRTVYGLHQAPCEWHDTLRTMLAALGFAPSTADPSLFLRTDTWLRPFYILVYVYDLVFATGDIEALALVKPELQKRHTCSDLVLQRFGFWYSSPQSTPLRTSHSLSAPPSDASVEPSSPYPELVGCLMYLMTFTRPDLAYPLSILARYVTPGRHRPENYEAAKRVLRYLCSTLGMGLVLGGRGPVVLTGHEDASWVDDLASQRSSQGYTFCVGSSSVS
ncbi:unnamed protein product [Closterium sp. NIES-54]